MRFSFGWLKRHLKTDKSINEIANALTFIGLEVEEVIDYKEIFKNFVIAKAVNVQKHPNADKLHTCEAILKDGGVKHIVCGAQNLREGLHVILALPGAKIPANGEILKQSKIRGVASEGMFCSLEELGLEKESSGIVELPDDVDMNSDIGSLLGVGEGIIDISITPNRGDCFCIEGVARDLAAAGMGEFIPEKLVDVKPQTGFDVKIDLVSTADPNFVLENIPFCAFRIIRGIKNGQSPVWLQSLLKSADLNPISSVVDFANFMTFDVCRPFHVYDLNKVGKILSLRQANNGEVFVDLHEKTHILNSDVIVAANEKLPLCIMGIMGGKDCSCDENTTDILIESAVFNPVYISNCGNKVNIVSDSRTRFERGINGEYALQGLDRLTQYIVENCGGTVSDVYTIGSNDFERKKVTLTEKKLNMVAGTEVNFSEAVAILEKLQIKVISKEQGKVICEIPSFRNDLAIEEDLVEEVLRIKGYDSIPLIPLPKNNLGIKTDVLNKYKKIAEIKRAMCACGLSEVCSFSFIDSKQAKLFMSDEIHTSQQIIGITNPISEDLSVMRNSLYPNLFRNSVNQLNLSAKSVSLFELGPIFYAPNTQQTVLCGLRCGRYGEKNWIDQNRNYDVFDIKTDCLQALKVLGVDEEKVSFNTNALPEWYHPTRSAAIVLYKKIIGYFGELHPNILNSYDIKLPCVGFEIFLDSLLEMNKKKNFDYNNYKVFQSVDRDFSFVFTNNLKAEELIKGIRACDDLIQHVGVFDYYKIDDESVAIGITVTIKPKVSTLTDDEIKVIYNKIIKKAESIGCELRQ